MEAVKQIEYKQALYNVKDAEAQKSLVYSQNETDTGKIWIDGKKIYRKVMLLPAIAKDKEYNLDLSNLNASTYVQINGFVQTEEDNFQPLLNSNRMGASYNIFVAIYKKKLRVVTGTSREILSGHVILEYTKTTN